MTLFNYLFRFLTSLFLFYSFYKYVSFFSNESIQKDELFFGCLFIFSLFEVLVVICCFFIFLYLMRYSNCKKEQKILLLLSHKSKKLYFFEKFPSIYYILTFFIPVKVLISNTTLTTKTSFIIFLFSFFIWIFSLEIFVYILSLLYIFFLIEAFLFLFSYNNISLFKRIINKLILVESSVLLSKNFLKVFFGKEY